MPKVKPELFAFLDDSKIEATLSRLYTEALKQGWSMVFHFLPKAFKMFGKGIDWKKNLFMMTNISPYCLTKVHFYICRLGH